MKRSFTVTELLVVIAIVVILAGILIGGMGYAGRRADDAKTISAIQELSAALEAYRAEKGFYPPSRDGGEKYVRFYRSSAGKLFIVFTKNPDKNTGGYVSDAKDVEYSFVSTKNDKAFMELNSLSSSASSKTDAELFTDAWGVGLRYQCPGNHNKASFDLSSHGRDKTANNEDDISNWINASQQ